ncbi:MAG: SAM-dependent methyltransferase [Ponticaulis sp.]|nr:SAM-dependent methyltransferase [Ponticaulis sp.]
MGLYSRYILPTLIDCACSTRPIRRQREKVVPLAAGDVLEVGCGAGANFPLYNAQSVRKVFALEPAEKMIERAEQAAGRIPDLDIEFLRTGGEAVPLEAASVDTVVFTFTLCTIPDWRASLAEARRVLKPGGRLIYSEHGGAPDPGVARWQRRLEPIQKRFGGGCHLTRVPPDMLSTTGFEIVEGQTMYLPKTPKVMGYAYWGQARAA